MNEKSNESAFLNAESIDLQDSIFIKAYHKFLIDMTPPMISRVVSYPPLTFNYQINYSKIKT